MRVKGRGFRVYRSCELAREQPAPGVVVQVLAPDEVLLAAHEGPFTSDEVIVFRL